MVILIGGEKGGTGKTTIATNLAVWLASKGRDVLLLDADKQGTAGSWAVNRAQLSDAPRVHCVQRHGNLMAAVKDLRERYQDIIIDAGGRDSEELRTGMVAADAVYTPIKASQFDLWTIKHMDHLVSLARGFNERLQAFTVLSMAPTNPRITEVQDAAEMLETVEQFRLARTVVRERKAFRDAVCDGHGVIEMEDAKAIAEVEALGEEIYGQV